jgi:hypothetical protein
MLGDPAYTKTPDPPFQRGDLKLLLLDWMQRCRGW